MQGRSWVFVAGGSRQSRRRRRREFVSRRLETPIFLIEFVQISGVHLIVPGGPEVQTPCPATPLASCIKHDNRLLIIVSDF
jgi:hypothetical protein